MVFVELLLLLGILSGSFAWTHSWDTVGDQLWADFGIRRGYSSLLEKTPNGETVGEFIANTYQIVSLEKCLYGQPYSTEAEFANASATLKKINPNLKVLFYYNVDLDVWTCYKAGPKYNDTPSWWIYNDAGKVVPPSNPGLHSLNSSVPSLRDYWSNVTVTLSGVVNASEADRLVDGVFADGLGHSDWQGVSAERSQAVAVGRMLLGNETRSKLNKPVFGNGIAAYPQFPTHNMDFIYSEDGACTEHVAAFEQVLDDGSLNVAMTSELMTNMVTMAAAGKVVLVRTWPGPVVTPINSLGPSYPAKYAPTPATYAERAAAANDPLHKDFALAIYLIVANDTTFFNYDWWYDLDDGVYPCSANCSAPANWFPEWKNPLGPPTSSAQRYYRNGTHIGAIASKAEQSLSPSDVLEATVYQRTFEHASVYLDLSSRQNTKITWN